jgi:hypothetical protein
MRFTPLVFLFFFLIAAAPGCFLPDDHCSGDARVASRTPPLTGAALDQWNHSDCSSDEDGMCSQGIPRGNALELCTHDPNAMATDGGAVMALGCHYYSVDKSCHSSSHVDD